MSPCLAASEISTAGKGGVQLRAEAGHRRRGAEGKQTNSDGPRKHPRRPALSQIKCAISFF